MAANKNVSVTLRIDGQLKAEVEEVFDKLGLDFCTAVQLFCRQTVNYQGLPFMLRAPRTTMIEWGEDENLILSN